MDNTWVLESLRCRLRHKAPYKSSLSIVKMVDNHDHFRKFSANMERVIFIGVVLCLSSFVSLSCGQREIDAVQELYSVEGKVYPPDGVSGNSWYTQTQIMANGGEFLGFLKKDGSFTIANVPSGSYVIEVVHPSYAYEPYRVEINSKGKFRARKVNYIQTSTVDPVDYPLSMFPIARLRYFQLREQWRLTDFLYSPMVLMMVLPLALLMILPKMMNDPETRKEMEQINTLTKLDMPEFSEVLTNYFGGDSKKNSRAVRKKKIQ